MKSKLASLLFSISTILGAQNVTFIGDFDTKTQSMCSDHFRDFKFKMKHFASGSDQVQKIKHLNKSIISPSTVTLTNFESIFVRFNKKIADSKSNIVYIKIDEVNDRIKDKFFKNKTTITIEEFLKDIYKYQNTTNLVMLIPSEISCEIIYPKKKSIITNYKPMISGVINSNYTISKLKITVNSNSSLELDAKDFLTSNEDGTCQLDLPIDESLFSNDKNINITLIIIDKLNQEIPKVIPGITIENSYLIFKKDNLGTIDPKTYLSTLYYEIDINSNINFSDEEDSLEISFYDLNKQVLRQFTKTIAVKFCPADKKLLAILDMEMDTPVPYVNNLDLLVKSKFKIEPEYNETMGLLCGSAWHGYIKIAIKGSHISTNFTYVKLWGVNRTGNTPFEYLKCR